MYTELTIEQVLNYTYAEEKNSSLYTMSNYF
jgi:hypothetical protein